MSNTEAKRIHTVEDLQPEDYQKILSGEVTNLRIEGHLYSIIIDGEVVVLHCPDSGDDARSTIDYSEYAYTHGGRIFREACRVAKEIFEQRRKTLM